jgi:hypothetical protein
VTAEPTTGPRDDSLPASYDEPEDIDTRAADIEESEPVSLPLSVDLVNACRQVLSTLSTGGPLFIGVTSPGRGDGRSSVALGLALALRQSRSATLLLDLDSSSQADASTDAGVDAVVRFSRGSMYSAVEWLAPGLGRLSGQGSTGVQPWSQARLAYTSACVNALLDDGYALVGDLPPLPPCGQADSLLPLVSDTVLVLRAGSTTAEDAKRAFATFSAEPAVILNGVRTSLPRWLTLLMGR